MATLRVLTQELGWLEPVAVLPDDAVIAASVGQVRRARSTIASVESCQAIVER